MSSIPTGVCNYQSKNSKKKKSICLGIDMSYLNLWLFGNVNCDPTSSQDGSFPHMGQFGFYSLWALVLPLFYIFLKKKKKKKEM